MLEFLVLVTFIGLLLGSRPKLGFGNPFQIYFFVWFLVVFGFFLTRNTFVPVPSEYFLLILTSKTIALLILGAVTMVGEEKSIYKHIKDTKINGQLVVLAQFLVTVGLVFVYFEASSLAGGDVFSVSGYIKLRIAKTYFGEGFGALGYFLPLSFVVTSLIVFLYCQKKIRLLSLVFSSVVSLCYAYFSTGRTFVLLLFCILFFPLVLLKIIDTRKFVLFLVVLVCSFLFISAMTAKGVSFENDLYDNFNSLFSSVKNYTLAPFVALYSLTEKFSRYDLGLNTFRFFHAIAYSFGLSHVEPVSLIQEYSYTPNPVNVYTVYDVYFKDFGFLGFFIPPLFLIGHFFLYKMAKLRGGLFIFFYSASVYPLVMQFFQDQYFSLMSQWIQFVFWYSILFTKINFKLK